MKKVLEKFKTNPKIFEIIEKLKNKENIAVSKVIYSYFAFIVSALYEVLQKDILIIAEDYEQSAYFYNDLENILGSEKTHFFPTSYKKSQVAENYKYHTPFLMMRAEVLRNLANEINKKIIVSYPEAVAEKVPVNKQLKSRQFTINKGDEIDTEFLEEWLIEEGFNRVEFVYEPGQFAVRGSIIDIFSYATEYPYRIDFFGDEVEKIKTFNVETQLSLKEVDSITVLPDIRTNKDEKQHTLFLNNLPNDTLIVTFDSQTILEQINDLFEKNSVISIENEFEELEKILIASKNELETKLKDFTILEFSNYPYFSSNNEIFKFKVKPQPLYQKNFYLLAETLEYKKQEGFEIFILSKSEKQIQRLKEIFASEEINKPIDFEHISGIIKDGFIDEEMKILVFTEHQIFGKYHRHYLKDYSYTKAKNAQLLKQINELKIGDYVVHQDFGIGIFRGLTTIVNNGKEYEVFRIDYKDNDVIYASVHSLHKISKYKSSDGEPPTIHSLKSRAWKNLKQKAKSKVKDIAKQLISLYAKRLEAKGYAFSKDNYLQEALEGSFMYEETPDQLKAIEDVKKDMEKPIPMDRLVCGDVGFGKTEVAIRAAFKAVSDGKQVAVLCPTTVLTYQHYKTFTERMKDFPVNIDFISRLKTPKQQKETLKKLAEGKIDIIIGTHRLVSKDVKFKDLGLLIIDEEQRFGVAVKEKLREIKVNVDTLTLTATPIPRTLEFSLMGARDLSIINTSPPNRRPIITEVHTFNSELIKNAIELEVSRGGQVFFVHNDINGLESIKNLIERLLPQIKVALAHGRMKASDLEQIMTDFINKKYDVLVATTIIENGLDIPNANTIIINNAHKFGLSQLHQLRGRVGRSDRQAFCYLLAPPKNTLNSNARRRLETIEMFSEIGSGFNIALQDLDIRGAGNLLGAEQSGFINDIGLETFKTILKEALQELKIEELTKNPQSANNAQDIQWVSDCKVNTTLKANIPKNYINDVSERIKIYKEINSAANEEELTEIVKKIEDRFGNLPIETKELLNIVRLRWLAMKLGIEKIVLEEDFMLAYFVSDQSSAFYDSDLFKNGILKFIAENKQVKLKHKNDKLYIYIPNIRGAKKAKEFLEKMLAFTKIEKN